MGNKFLALRKSEVIKVAFSTAAPFQRSVEIHVLQGERPMAKDNKTIGNFKLNGIKKAPAGVPQIEVTFDIDANGILKVSAKDLDTGKEQSITISNNEKMSDAEIEAAIRDAEQYASQDQTRRDALEIANSAGRTLEKAEQALKNAGKQIPKEEKKQIRNECAALRKLITKTRPENMTDDDIAEIKNAAERLEQSSSRLVQMTGENM